MTDTVLFVDDEVNVLNSVRRLFIDDDVKVLTASGAAEALDIVRQNEISLIVSDNLMPGMNGIEFLQRVKDSSPDIVRILMTAYADIRAAIDAINKGGVYKFVTKPWDDRELREIVLEALKRYRVVQSLKKADDATLRSLAQTIELKDPYTRGHCDRVAEYALRIAEALNMPEEMKVNIKHGSWLHDCGKIGVPDEVLNYNGPLSEERMSLVKNHSRWGADVALTAHLPAPVINIILHHHEQYNGQGYPGGLKGNEIPLEARVVTVADVYDALTSDRPYREKMTRREAREFLKFRKSVYFDPGIVDIFLNITKEGPDD